LISGAKFSAADGSLAGKARCQYGEEERRNIRFLEVKHIWGTGNKQREGDYPKGQKRIGKGKGSRCIGRPLRGCRLALGTCNIFGEIFL
jgi:hypothetical protein